MADTRKVMHSLGMSRHRHPSFIVILLAILVFNLSPLFKLKFSPQQQITRYPGRVRLASHLLEPIEATLRRIVVALELVEPSPLQVEALMLTDMARMWYIKKKIRKIGKKLRKSTIALPIFTTIPIHGHSY